jgi:ABC-type microcin C transport system permease subunit YejB
MIAPLRGVSGNAVAHSRPNGQFPAAVQMMSSSALSDILIGQRRWSDPEVIEELNVVLGSDNAAALRYIHEVRVRLMERYEQQEFGTNSFFVCGDS